jgi:hypothetical protein
MDNKNNQTHNRLNIINLSELDPSWNWLANEFDDPNLSWSHYSTHMINVPKVMPKKQLIKRLISTKDAVQTSKKQHSLIVSHEPRPTLYSAVM